MRILIVVNVDWFFISHRLPIAVAALENGHDVFIATTFTTSENKSFLRDLGFQIYDLSIDRSGRNPLGFLDTFFRCFFIGIFLKPDIVHLVTIQPVLLGGIAFQLAGCKRIIYAISGLGHVFLGKSVHAQVRRFFIVRLYRLALSSRHRIVLFQNSRDKELLKSSCKIPASDCRSLAGSGVDLSTFTFHDLPPLPFTIVLASRLLSSKGVLEFVQAAQQLKKSNPSLRFQLVGSPDSSNPLSISPLLIEQWVSDGTIEYLGFRTDLSTILSNSHIFCLPSYYPEGLPKAICEAAACGRAVITTVEPGCRDAVVEGVTGVLVPSRNSSALARAISDLTLNPEKLVSMGHAARKHAELFFDIKHIVEMHLQFYNELFNKSV
ncbi:glycosyltransferase family 4 protein [Synechococcus sp. MU1651]|uniref:glycosyltransferase family 4 protein n=1 Tax=Synechococcus sp. MU1651 TaxID=2508353 RepID=UPI0020269F30|nr:glycosyltransferase family 4 protein [Synechococcus sp. MU1651]